MILHEAAPILRCPHCGASFSVRGRSLRCGNGHTFDVARQGYVNLLRGDEHTGTADTAAMVEARRRFLAGNHLAGVRDRLAAQSAGAAATEGCVLDAGAGTGYHTAAVLDRCPERLGLALDIAKPALRKAAAAHGRILAVGCDVWRRLPVADEAAAVALSVFAPRNGKELARVLAPGGALVVATPQQRHLGELVAALDLLTVDPAKGRRLEARLAPHLYRVDVWGHDEVRPLTRDDITAAVEMGPTARHVDMATLRRRVAHLPEPLPVTVAVEVSTWRRPGEV